MRTLKGLVVAAIAGLLVLPVAALGQTVSVNVYGGDPALDAGSGARHDAVADGSGRLGMLDVWNGAATASGSFHLWTTISSDIPLDSVTFDILVNGGADNGLFTSARAVAGADMFPPNNFRTEPGLGTLFHLSDPLGERFAPGDVIPNSTDVGLALSGNPVGAFKSSAGQVPLTRLADNETFLGWQISFEDLPVGQYDFTVGQLGQIPTEWSAAGSLGQLSPGNTFTLVPEPASALLLLVALPLLRRRRA